MGKILRELIERLRDKNVEGSQEVEVRGITCDSRKVEEGFLFVCIPGFNFDGHTFIPEAIKNGACALMVEKDVPQRETMTVIKVPDARYALGILADRFYDCPSNKLRVVGIAGTNGKTTTSYLAGQILREAGKKTALLGTISYQLGDKVLPAPWTTPPSLELQSMFKELVEDDFDSVVMEVTSHALTLDRVAGCEFDVGVFNNLSRDHLDFHKTMEDYLEAEAKLFRLLNRSSKTRKKAIINIDDPYAEHIIQNTTVKILTFGINQEACLRADTHRRADVRAYDISSSVEGLRFNVATPVGKTTICLQLLGRHNVYNALAAIGVGISEGINLNEIKGAMAKVKNVPGRFEFIDCGQP
ncbi:UDP-N-acetylmuramoyl-L-alanyl-D-glutamate--2,6-diaminopimelate ligase, partial [candidate division NPL-UPA2 bacterium]|nr:UDP-N-acetylmuramoyl-L-alanyl-D-glutamate--2,6-diaminopimelate ligase [candidate division NPL-UPA2 bacterium]